MSDLVERLRAELRCVTAERNRAQQACQQMGDEIERLRAALERIIDHDPSKPGLRYESAEQLLESLIAIAEDTLAAERGGGKS